MTNEQSAVLQHLRRTSHHGERSCRWCRREMMGDHAELLHLLCAPDLDQMELFRADMRRLEWSRHFAHCFLGLAFSPLVLSVLEDGPDWMDLFLVGQLAATLLAQRWFWLDQLRLTRGMWRKARTWQKEAR